MADTEFTQLTGASLEPLPGKDRGFGVIVRNLPREQLARTEVREALKTLWLQSGVIVFRECETTPQYLTELSESFGELLVHPIKEQTVEGHPQLIRINAEERVFVVEGEEIAGWAPWHVDLIYTTHPNRGSLLCSVKLPEAGGNTGFVDLAGVYDRLPAQLKAAVEDREIVYMYRTELADLPYATRKNAREKELSDYQVKAKSREEQDFRPIVHPLVITLPNSDRKVLHLSPAGAFQIRGLTREASHDLLTELVDYVEDESFAYFHQWQVGDLLLWDNWRMVHCAAGVAPQMTRKMLRTTIAGPYPLGRELETASPAFA